MLVKLNPSNPQMLRRARAGADVAALDAQLDAMRRDLDLLQQYATQDAVRVDGATVAARCARWTGSCRHGALWLRPP